MNKVEKEAFRSTPFGHFLNLPNITTDNEIVGWFVEHYDTEEVGLRIGSGVVPLTPEDIALILGLRTHGKAVVMEPLAVQKRDGVNLDNTQLLVHLLANSTMGETEEYVRLLISFIFNNFLFYDGTLRPKEWFMHPLRNIKRLSSYAWASAVHQTLVGGLEKASLELQERKKAGNFIMRQGNVEGCVAILHVSFCSCFTLPLFLSFCFCSFRNTMCVFGIRCESVRNTL